MAHRATGTVKARAIPRATAGIIASQSGISRSFVRIGGAVRCMVQKRPFSGNARDKCLFIEMALFGTESHGIAEAPSQKSDPKNEIGQFGKGAGTLVFRTRRNRFLQVATGARVAARTLAQNEHSSALRFVTCAYTRRAETESWIVATARRPPTSTQPILRNLSTIQYNTVCKFR